MFINPLAFLGGNSQEQRQKMTKITKIVLKNCLFYGVFSKTFLKTWRKMRRKIPSQRHAHIWFAVEEEFADAWQEHTRAGISNHCRYVLVK